MPMRATTVRFTDDLWGLLEAEAAAQGISAAQFVRDTAIMRLGVLSARRGDTLATVTLRDIASTALAGRDASEPNEVPAVVHDRARLEALHRSGLLDTPPEEAFDRLTELVAKVLDVPVVLVSLVDDDRQFFKSAVGLEHPWRDTRETPLSHSFCQHALSSSETLVIEDARRHPLVRENLAIRDLHVIAYLGVPLIAPGGETLGTLCAIDHRPRAWTREDIDTLEVLAASVMSEIELHTAAKQEA
jgi:GAF domain-containing protein